MLGIIYCATNTVNGKRYVGQTVRSLKRRWQFHLKSAKDGSECTLHRAIRKYGAEAFKVEQIDFAESPEDLNEKEVRYILLLKTLTPNGYNLTRGGEGSVGYSHSEEIRQRMSKVAQFRPPVSAETRQKMSKAQIKTHCKFGHPFDSINTYVRPGNGQRCCLTCWYLRSSFPVPRRLLKYLEK